ncbi:MAG: PD40 domain-containing protein [Anaerolineae bacterium]|nr:PD40 domain-containing protein [Anaerolineae bacterium]
MQLNLSSLEGRQLGQYTLRKLLGSGGMGAVYSAYQANLDREVAIKVLTFGLGENQEYIERFNREALIVAKLEHANIVPIHDYGTEDNLNYVVMRLLTGGSLEERLEYHLENERPLPSLDEIMKMLHQLAGALDYAHKNGVIHRDIKPSNVMFDQLGNGYLVDFGIARLMEAATQLTSTGTTVGTPAYMAPEQWLEEEITGATDQYAVGVMAFNLLGGRLPFEATSPLALGHKHISELPPPISSIRPELGTAIDPVFERVLDKSPQNRFPNVSSFVDALDHALTQLDLPSGLTQHTGFFTTTLPKPRDITPTQVDLPSSASQASISEPVKSRSMSVLVITFAMVLILGFLGVSVWQSQQPTPSGLFVAIGLVRTDTPTPTATLTPSNTPTPTSTPTATATSTPSATATPSASATNTATATVTPSQTSTPTVTPTNTIDPLVIARQTRSALQTATAASWTDTPTPDLQATIDMQLTEFFIQDQTATAEAWTDTPMPSPTATPTITPTATNTSTALPTATVVPTSMPTPASVIGSTNIVTFFNGTNQGWNPVIESFNGVEMVLVPAGCFMMGNNGSETYEQPVHEQCFDEPFWIDRYEVTNAQYGSSGDFSGPNQPREDMTWYEARDYCESRGSRLPTEREWEYAARGPSNYLYPWGDTYDTSRLIYKVSTQDQTASVGSRPSGISWVGAFDMAGNVWEWTSTIHAPYPYDTNDGRENSSDTTSARVLRGGSWDHGNETIYQSSYRGGIDYPLSSRDNGIGFRCVTSFETVVSGIAKAPATNLAPLPTTVVTSVPTEIANFECPGAYGPSFTIGQRFYVPFGDGPSSVREERNSLIVIGEVAEGEGGIIIGGPECADGQQGNLVAWQVRTDDNLIGWMREGYPDSPMPWILPGDYIPDDNSALLPPTVIPQPTIQAVAVSSEIAFRSNRDGNQEIYLMDIDTGQVRNLSNHPNLDWWPSFSPDGQRIAFIAQRGGTGEVYIMNADGTNQTRLTHPPSGTDWAPAWSPDGSRIAFASDRDGEYELFVINVNGTNERQLTNNGAIDYAPSWSPDGQSIVFQTDRDGNREIYVIDVNSGMTHRLTVTEAQERQPQWSPDGNWIVFMSDRTGNQEIFKMDTNGGNVAQLTFDGAEDWYPSWSPDGQSIIFSSDRSGDFEIYTMSAADGSNLQRLTASAGDDLTAIWRPAR